MSAVQQLWQKYAVWVLGAVFLFLLVLKFFWPFFHFNLPLGYDAGIYRYLFLRSMEALPPFTFPDLPPWAREHPPGLFFFSSLLLRLGFFVDWLIGWLWNLFPVLLSLCSSVVVAKRWGREVGVVMLLLFSLAPAFYDGFAAMYWKTFVSLFWMVLSLFFFERKQWVFGVVFGLLVLLTHHQTGLLLGLVLGSWFLLLFFSSWVQGNFHITKFFLFLLITTGSIILVFFLYGEGFHDIVQRILPLFLQGWHAPPGNFPPPEFYLTHAWPLLLLGLIGFFWSLREERWTPWQLAVLWSAFFIVFRLMFYRRFFLHFEFFLLPFAARGVVILWRRWGSVLVRGSIVVLLVVQAVFTVRVMSLRFPAISSDVFFVVTGASEHVPDDALVLALEPTTAPFLRGWLARQRVGGPGLFDSLWYEKEWERFLLGTSEERKELLATLHGPVFLFASPEFFSLYGADAERFIADPCFEKVGVEFLYRTKEECLTPSP